MFGNKIKSHFPFFAAHPDAVYFDSAATTQKPEKVITVLKKFYQTQNANAGRASYELSSSLLHQVEAVRVHIAGFLGAEKKEEVFYASGATSAQERIAYAFLPYFQDGDEILYSPLDHQSFVLPWLDLQKNLAHFDVHINLIPYRVKETGQADIDDIQNRVTPKTKLINITHIHNIFGTESELMLLKGLKEKGVIINVDAAQSIGHIPVDVQKLGISILSFSGHKLFGPLGSGAFYIHHELQLQLGIDTSFEMGTQNYAAILGLDSAISFIEKHGVKNIHAYLQDLTRITISELSKIPGLSFTKGVANHAGQGHGIVSFVIEGYESADLAFALSKHNILLRAGHHCNMSPIEETNALRVSLQIYNTKEDIDFLVQTLKKLLS